MIAFFFLSPPLVIIAGFFFPPLPSFGVVALFVRGKQVPRAAEGNQVTRCLCVSSHTG